MLFAQHEQHPGTPDFDLLPGIAALDSGHPSQAFFAFERVLACLFKPWSAQQQHKQDFSDWVTLIVHLSAVSHVV